MLSQKITPPLRLNTPQQRKHYSEYLLQDLLGDHGYSLDTRHNDVSSVVNALSLPVPTANSVVVVGINGPTCAGKTSFTKALAEALASRNFAVEQISFDWFLYDRSTRSSLVEDISNGIKSIPEVTSTAWELDRYMGLLSLMKNSRESGDIRLDGIYDRKEGTQTGSIDLTVPRGGYVLVEGVGILDVGTAPMIDYHIRLDVNDDEILIKRAIEREQRKPLDNRVTEEFLRWRFEIMDLHHMRYLRQISYDHNRHIIDVSNFNQIKVYSKSYA